MIEAGQTVRAGSFFAEHFQPEEREKYHIRPLALGEPSLLVETKRGEKLVGADHQITYLGDGLWQI